jgi:hypothetical protein
VESVYEGPEVLTALLGRAGSPHDASEVAELFGRALGEGEDRSDVIPMLFPREPRFAEPADARRLFANLFGLWERVAAGLGPDDDAPEVSPPPPRPVPAPERGSLAGAELTADFVEEMWRHLAGLADREERRLRDRFQNVQGDLAAWLDAVELPEAGALAASDLCFETWAMFDQAFGERLGPVGWPAIRALESEPPPLESEQPALAAYAAEQLDNLADEEAAFGAPERAQVERVVAAIAAALTRSVAPPRDAS